MKQLLTHLLLIILYLITLISKSASETNQNDYNINKLINKNAESSSAGAHGDLNDSSIATQINSNSDLKTTTPSKSHPVLILKNDTQTQNDKDDKDDIVQNVTDLNNSIVTSSQGLVNDSKENENVSQVNPGDNHHLDNSTGKNETLDKTTTTAAKIPVNDVNLFFDETTFVGGYNKWDTEGVFAKYDLKNYPEDKNLVPKLNTSRDNIVLISIVSINAIIKF